MKHYLLFALLLSVWPSIGLIAQPPKRAFEEYEKYHGAQEIASVPIGPIYHIRITSQKEFSQLNDKVRKAIRDGKKNIEVEISEGKYYYDRLPIYLYNIDAPEVSISIRGNGAIMIAGGADYRSGSRIKVLNIEASYLKSPYENVDCWGQVQQLSSEVKIIDKSKKICSIDLPERIIKSDGMKIQLSEWYHSPVYEILEIKNGKLYFIADDLSYDENRKCYNVNYDVGVAKRFPRFRILNPKQLLNISGPIHECSVSEFLCLYRLKLKSFSISGISFNGAAKGKKNGLFYFSEVEAEQVSLINCSFENINHRIVQLNDTDNFLFKNNSVKNCMYDGIYSSTNCDNTIIINNSFYRLGRAWTNSSAVSCFGKQFTIANNTFEDIGYSSITAGAHVNWTKERITSGVIENNHIWFGEEYFRNSYKYNLIDGGAIYLATMNDLIVVRYNYIHNYAGINSNRAIYCDEGAMNVKIYGNIIRDIPHGHSIFSWRANSVNKRVPESNDGIDVFYNVIWGSYRFDERAGSSCIRGKNLVLYDDKVPETTIVNFAYQEKDILSKGASIRDCIIILPSSAMKELKKFPTYEGLKQWVR